MEEGPRAPRNERAWAAWERLGAPRFVMAPMVDGSDLPFRSLCRRLGTQLCFAPMVSAKAFAQYVGCKRVLTPMFDTEPGDRPLFFQLSGNEPGVCVRAALLAAPHVDGVDLNLGCPQHIAARSRYGAFLMAEVWFSLSHFLLTRSSRWWWRRWCGRWRRRWSRWV